MIDADEARRLAAAADPTREQAEADVLAANALKWALHNAEGRTDTRIRLYAAHGNHRIAVKFAPGPGDAGGNGNSFYNDLVGSANIEVADAICDIIYGREQTLISPIQSMRTLNTFNARLVKFVRDLTRYGYDVQQGSEKTGNSNIDDSSLLISW